MGLALGKDIQTDCSINAQVQGKTYCFGSKEAMGEFMKNLDSQSRQGTDLLFKETSRVTRTASDARGPFILGKGPFAGE